MSFVNLIEKIKEELRKGAFKSEAAVSQGILLPILHELGWPVFDTNIVIPEYSVEGRRADYALCNLANRPTILIEVKRVGLSEGADKQLFEYAFFIGVPMAILTDGQEWSFYLPAETGKYDERRVYKLDLLERSSEEASERLMRYLSFERTNSGEAIKAARSDYQNVARDREIEVTFPKAWNSLLEEKDSLLLDLVAEKVEDICGYKPDLESCSQFIEAYTQGYSPKPAVSPIRPFRKPSGSRTRAVGHYDFSFKNEQYSANSAREVMIRVFQLLVEEDSEFLERFAARKHGRKRRYISQDKRELYPNRPDLCENESVQIIPGWWIGTNYSRRDIQKIINLACEVAGPRLGSSMQVKIE